MRISGVVVIEGVQLVVNVDAPDDEREIYVTNLHPSFVVVPRERWPVEYLNLSAEVVADLKGAGIHTLWDFTNGAWEVRLPSTVGQHFDAVTNAIGQVRQLAITFEIPTESSREMQKREAVPIGQVVTQQEAVVHRPVSGTLGSSLISIGVPDAVVSKLRRARGEVETIRDLLTLGRRKLVMTTGISAQEVTEVEERIRGAGFDWNTSLEASSK